MPSNVRIYMLIFLMLLQYILTFLTLAYILLMYYISSLVWISNDSHVQSYSYHNIANHPNTFRRSSTTRWRQRQEHLYQFPGVVGNCFLNPDDSNTMPNPQYCGKLPAGPHNLYVLIPPVPSTASITTLTLIGAHSWLIASKTPFLDDMTLWQNLSLNVQGNCLLLLPYIMYCPTRNS